jgi:hypothetical protein
MGTTGRESCSRPMGLFRARHPHRDHLNLRKLNRLDNSVHIHLLQDIHELNHFMSLLLFPRHPLSIQSLGLKPGSCHVDSSSNRDSEDTS